MRAAAILCCHCGRDYAREYWAMQQAGDPYVCKSCRRDTNRDAADAPRWIPGAAVADVQLRQVVVTESRKQCRVCRGEWDGLIFGPPAAKGSPLPFGICPTCGEREDAALARMSARTVSVGMPLPELQRPRRTVSDG